MSAGGRDVSLLPYRPNVGAALFSKAGQVLVARRADMAPGLETVWQMPQGGIDADEDPRAAVLRELREEIGTANAAILAEHPDWIQYDLPQHLIGRALGGRFRGQRQRWFALRFLGEDTEIKLDTHTHPEFDAWRWVSLAELPLLAPSFKRAVYEVIAQSFAPYGSPHP